MTIKLSNGNSKLVSTNDCRFLIFSIPPIVTCPNATEHCIKCCYANNSYRMYPNVRKAWDGNLVETMSVRFVSNMINAINEQLARPSYKRAKRIVIRIHESGDFYAQIYADKWMDIAKHFADDERITFMAYTKSVGFFMGCDIPKNMVVRFSLWDDTEPCELAKAESKGLPIYTAVESFTNEPKKERCLCKDCGHCRKCWNRSAKMIKCEIH